GRWRKPSLAKPSLDEGRLRRASQLFASMLRGEPAPRSRRRSEPPKESRLGSSFRSRLQVPGVRRASSVDAREVLSRPPLLPPLRPLNGQMPWFPGAMSMTGTRRALSTGRPRLPWAKRTAEAEKELR
ncbi:unnamed protein product, partial [Effrenium voratum]